MTRQRILAALLACAVLAGCDTTGNAPPTAAPGAATSAPAPGGEATAAPAPGGEATAAPSAPGYPAPQAETAPTPYVAPTGTP